MSTAVPPVGIGNATQVNLAEFDAFGPWIDVVSDASEIPRLYRGFPVDFATAELVLKVPRNISRRDADPAMDLYDHLIVVGDAQLTVLSRHDAWYSELTVGFEQIAIIVDSVNLLDGVFTLHTLSGQTVSFVYNGASEKVVARLVDLLRRREQAAIPALLPGARRPAITGDPLPPLGLDDLGKKDAVFVTSYGELLGREPGLRLLAAHGRRVLAVTGGVAVTVAHLVKPAVLNGALLCATETELQLISRRDWITRNGAPEVSRSRTIVPLAKLTGVTSRPHPLYSGAQVVTLAAGGSSIEIVLPAESPLGEVLLRAAP